MDECLSKFCKNGQNGSQKNTSKQITTNCKKTINKYRYYQIQKNNHTQKFFNDIKQVTINCIKDELGNILTNP